MSDDGGHREFELSMTLDENYRFTVDFGEDFEKLLLDEPEPLGENTAPNASRILGAAVGNCLSASLLFCMRRARIDVDGMKTRIQGSVVRNAEGRMRIGEIRVLLEPTMPEEEVARMGRCLDLFEDFCIVTESVRRGVDVLVEVQPKALSPVPSELKEAVPIQAV